MEGGGAEGAADVGGGADEDSLFDDDDEDDDFFLREDSKNITRHGQREGERDTLLSCSFSDIAMANCKSSSSFIFISSVGAWGTCDSLARELRRYSSGRPPVPPPDTSVLDLESEEDVSGATAL